MCFLTPPLGLRLRGIGGEGHGGPNLTQLLHKLQAVNTAMECSARMTAQSPERFLCSSLGRMFEARTCAMNAPIKSEMARRQQCFLDNGMFGQFCSYLRFFFRYLMSGCFSMHFVRFDASLPYMSSSLLLEASFPRHLLLSSVAASLSPPHLHRSEFLRSDHWVFFIIFCLLSPLSSGFSW